VRYQVGLSDDMVRRELRRLGTDPADLADGAAEALGRYRDLVRPLIIQGLDVRMDGKPAELIASRADIIRQQHAQLEFVYQIPYAPAGEPAHFVLVDENYSAVPGFHLAAIRGRGDVQILPAGPDRLFHRLPDIPSTEDPAANPIPSIRKIDAYIHCSASPSASTGRAGPEPAAVRETTALETEVLPASVAAQEHDAVASNVGEATTAADSQTSGIGGARRSAPVSGTRRGQVIWTSLFAALAVVIALLWIRSTRKEMSRSNLP
jgi:hypothetical protein